MKRALSVFALAAASFIGIASLAFAQPQGDRYGPHHGQTWAERLADLDTDGDGAISKDEADAPRLERFNLADANQDGALTMEEMIAYQDAERERRRAERQQKRFDRLDADSNGTISAEEFAARGDTMFDDIDADNNGIITALEAEAARETWRENRRSRRRDRR